MHLLLCITRINRKSENLSDCMLPGPSGGVVVGGRPSNFNKARCKWKCVCCGRLSLEWRYCRYKVLHTTASTVILFRQTFKLLHAQQWSNFNLPNFRRSFAYNPVPGWFTNQPRATTQFKKKVINFLCHTHCRLQMALSRQGMFCEVQGKLESATKNTPWCRRRCWSYWSSIKNKFFLSLDLFSI